jgi:hypothetical protein
MLHYPSYVRDFRLPTPGNLHESVLRLQIRGSENVPFLGSFSRLTVTLDLEFTDDVT